MWVGKKSNHHQRGIAVTPKNTNAKSLESWIWDAACSIRGAKDAPKYKDYILPLIFTKRLCDVFDIGASSWGSGNAGTKKAKTVRQWFVDHAKLQKNDYNISPSRYIHTGDAETYRPLAEIIADLDAVEAEARDGDRTLRNILKQLGV